MSEETVLAILAQELYEHFGSIKSRRFAMFTFLYAFLLGSAVNFVAGFLSSLVDFEFTVLYSIISLGTMFLLLIILFTKQHIIFGVPSMFYQKFFLTKKDGETSREKVYSLMLSILQSKISLNLSLTEHEDKIILKKKGRIFEKNLCIAENRVIVELGELIEVTLKYCNDEDGEQFSEEFLDDLYFQLRRDGFDFSLDKDSRPFGKFLMHSKFVMLDKLLERLESQ